MPLEFFAERLAQRHRRFAALGAIWRSDSLFGGGIDRSCGCPSGPQVSELIRLAVISLHAGLALHGFEVPSRLAPAH
ncbi:MAG: hypothetical protein QE494_06810 [Ramlibacter sp.]|uniref:hypothetical protein n=1 Tax=Ramlibacter sp. TaxID=1917967 RepID=UPI002612C8BD|nr:hypothetical protein [Ramlibacter sp.]MDH4375996.1 hypothetical protein [Ramlibacter sp.]